jgi:ABC-type polysaccharide/polyol phosphate export permease
MKTNRKSFLLSIPAWGLALLTAFFTLILVFFIAALFASIAFLNNDTGEFILYLFYGIMVFTACFYICRRETKSYWYVPLLSNIPGIISAIVEPSFWQTNMWILFVAVWTLSILGAAAGTFAGKRKSQNIKL